MRMRAKARPTPRVKMTTSDRRDHALKEGWRSGLEEDVAKKLTSKGVSYRYEAKEDVVRYEQPARMARYTPDFALPNGIIIETKGRFVTKDRQKHLLIKAQHPGLDIRFVFSNPNARISKESSTTYAMWCEKHGFKYCGFRDTRTWEGWCHEP